MSMMEYYERKQEYDNKNVNKRTCQRVNSMNGWTRTKDTLPDAGVPVLVYSFPNIEIATICKENNDEKVWWLRNVGTMDLRNYKWWMPLPEPPKEQKKRIKDHVCNNDYCKLE